MGKTEVKVLYCNFLVSDNFCIHSHLNPMTYEGLFYR